MISIIIPTLNEEKYLPLLLGSIKRQSFSSFTFVQDKDYEIILSDAGSKDKTVEIAKNYNCKIVSGGLPAKGRNEGFKVATGGILFFIDADAILPENFFEKSLQEFKKRNLEVASFCLAPIPPKKMSSFLLNIFYNRTIILLQNILPHAAMGILIKKELFKKIGGFDQEIKLAEDHYLARQAVRLFNAKFGIIKSTKIYVSDRRFKKDGWVSTGLRFFLCELYMIFFGPVKTNIFNYRFNHYNSEKPKGETKK